MDVMTEQHELSAIQEVETPADTSQVTGPEDSVKVPPHAVDRDLQEDSESSVTSDTSQQTPSWSISGERTAEQSTASGTSSGRSSNVIWRERQLMGAGTSPESSESDLVRRIISPPSSEPGRGADYSGPALTGYRSPTESAHRPPDSDCLSSTTISTGSYVTSDPEQNVNADKSPPLRRVEQGADLLDVSSPSGQSFGVKESSTEGHPRLAADSLFNDSSIQHIIDKYTRELNISLSTAGKTTDSESSYVEETGSSVSQQSLVRVSERRGADERSHQSLPSDTAGAQRSGLEWENTVNPILEHLPGEDTSMGVDQEQDSFRPLIGQLADQSSCLAGDQRVSAMERLVGHPSAHSSMIGQLTTGRPVSTSFDQGGWDSTLSRMIGRLSHHSSSHWLSGGQDFHGGQLMGQMPLEQSTTWLDESRMRPLVGELDESAAQHSGGSDERTHVDLGVSTEASGPSHPVLPPESSSRSVSVPAVNPHLQDQTNMDLGPERTEVFPGSDSFHPLLAEVTHNETADPSMTFHQPEHDGPTSPEGPPASGGSPASTPAEEIEIHTESEPSPEHLRTEDPSSCKADDPALQESYSQLTTSQNQTSESVLIVSPTMMSPEGADADRNAVSERLGNLWPVSDKLWEVGSEKGILEQSQITLVSLTDTTLEDQETAITEDEGTWEDKHQDGASEEGQKGHETEGTESSLSPDETPEDKNQAHPDSGTLLEFQWGPTRDQQEVHHKKRRALLQRSACRVEEIKAKATLAKIQPVSQAPSEAGEQSRSKESQPVPSKERSKTEPQHKTNTKSKGGQAELHQAEKTGFIKQKKPQLLPQVSDFRLKKVDEVKSCTPETRKLEVSEMHQRTQRLYEQLEEVKHQRAIRNRQEACAKNRLKAKEFHRKTLQKLRAKQTQTLL
ncbi:uncharacterized protein LOC117941633 [Etheostoma cragini]|uniref:uncharacterized protein LOC117941633 n=1 Tax=Etheostoma cragini TaxID=417921 RepID=UPI00155E6444|nr:uncharacterized protein LOC117941633 [Etheostoma cragini]